MCGYGHMSTPATADTRKCQIPCHLTWVLAIKLRPSGNEVSAISPALLTASEMKMQCDQLSHFPAFMPSLHNRTYLIETKTPFLSQITFVECAL